MKPRDTAGKAAEEEEADPHYSVCQASPPQVSRRRRSRSTLFRLSGLTASGQQKKKKQIHTIPSIRPHRLRSAAEEEADPHYSVCQASPPQVSRRRRSRSTQFRLSGLTASGQQQKKKQIHTIPSVRPHRLRSAEEEEADPHYSVCQASPPQVSRRRRSRSTLFRLSGLTASGQQKKKKKQIPTIPSVRPHRLSGLVVRRRPGERQPWVESPLLSGIFLNSDNSNDRTERRNVKFLQSPLCAANCLQHVRSSGLNAVECKARATH